MVTDPYKAVSCQFSFVRVHSYFVKRANLPINYQPISDFSPIWNNRSSSSSSRNLNSRGTTSRQLLGSVPSIKIHDNVVNLLFPGDY